MLKRSIPYVKFDIGFSTSLECLVVYGSYDNIPIDYCGMSFSLASDQIARRLRWFSTYVHVRIDVYADNTASSQEHCPRSRPRRSSYAHEAIH